MIHDTNYDDRDSFLKILQKQIDVDSILDWIEQRFSIQQIFSEKEIIDHITDTYNPDDVFSKQELEQWALDNGFVEEK